VVCLQGQFPSHDISWVIKSPLALAFAVSYVRCISLVHTIFHCREMPSVCLSCSALHLVVLFHNTVTFDSLVLVITTVDTQFTAAAVSSSIVVFHCKLTFHQLLNQLRLKGMSVYMWCFICLPVRVSASRYEKHWNNPFESLFYGKRLVFLLVDSMIVGSSLCSLLLPALFTDCGLKGHGYEEWCV
jgi:hypothetical protein